MFGRKRTVAAPPMPAGAVSLRYHTEAAVVADPDTPNLHRRRGLAYQIGIGLQGYSGSAVGYDRGDPAHSFQTVLQSASLPSAALARIGRPADALRMAPPAEITDIVMSDPALDPYQSLLWNRIAR